MNDLTKELSARNIALCSVCTLGVKEAPSLVAEMTRLLICIWADIRAGPEAASLWGENRMSGKADLAKVVNTALLLLRYLAGAGAQVELGNDRGTVGL